MTQRTSVPTPPSTAFGTQLRQYRERAGLTQEALAERAGLTANAINALKSGARRRPYPHTVQVLTQALQLSADVHVAPAYAIPAPTVAQRIDMAEVFEYTHGWTPRMNASVWRHEAYRFPESGGIPN